jgi:hypothetical protein
MEQKKERERKKERRRAYDRRRYGTMSIHTFLVAHYTTTSTNKIAQHINIHKTYNANISYLWRMNEMNGS